MHIEQIGIYIQIVIKRKPITAACMCEYLSQMTGDLQLASQGPVCTGLESQRIRQVCLPKF